MLLPWVVPTVLSALAFWCIYDAQFSIVSWSLMKRGLIDGPINFLGTPNNARASVIAANVWRGLPFVAISLLAGLQTIPAYLNRRPRRVVTIYLPLAVFVFNVGIYDSSLALILTYPTFLIPFCTWLLMGYFRSIPFELGESALVDGANRWQILTKIIQPLAVPALISAGIFAFTVSWNEFIYALTFIQSSENKTVPVGALTELVRGDIFEWGR